MTYNTKTEFLTGLRETLERNGIGINDIRDILSDFRQHFEDGAASGESEADVCAKLGDVDEIVRQYISDNPTHTTTSGSMPEASGFGAEGAPEQPYSQPRYAEPVNQSPHADGGKIAGVICLDIFLYSWALPTLLSLIVALYSVAAAFSATGISLFAAGLISVGIDLGGILMTGFAPLSIAALGVMFIGFGGMLVIASIGATKGFINLIIAIINQHSRAFAGKNVAQKIGKRNREVAY